MKKYHIAYFYWEELLLKAGSSIIIANDEEDIYTEEKLAEIHDFIIKKFGFDGCVILNIIPLNE